MYQIKDFLFPQVSLSYVEEGFSEKEARAMEYIGNQKAQGLYVGSIAGAVLAHTFGPLLTKVFTFFRMHLRTTWPKALIFCSTVAFSNYLFSVRRPGSDYWLTYWLRGNNRPLFANLDSLNSHFKPLNRRFTDTELVFLRQRAKAIDTNIVPLENRKWIRIEGVESEEDFARRKKFSLEAPWKDKDVQKIISKENAFRRKQVAYAPVRLSQLIDETCAKFGFENKIAFGFRTA